MNENLDLVEILKNCPKGTKLYLATIGCEVRLCWARLINRWPIRVIADEQRIYDLTRHGCVDEAYPNGECVLFPSKTQRDWSKFKVPVEKFDYSTLKPFDKVLVRDTSDFPWKCALFTCMIADSMICTSHWRQGIPYNDETKHLAGNIDKLDEKYIWWEE